MTKKEAAALYAKICAGEATDDEKKAFAAFFDGDGGDGKEEKKDADEAPPSSKDGKEEKKDADEAPPSSKDGKEEKTESKAHAKRSEDPARAMAEELAHANARIADLEVKSILDSRPDLFGTEAKPTAIRKWAKKQDPENLKSYIASAPQQMAHRPAKPTTDGSRTDTPSGAGVAPPPGLQGRDLEEVNRAMGIRAHAVLEPHRLADGTFVLPTVKPRDFREHAAKRSKAEASNGKGQV
jgi:hypothetical protein